MRDPCPMGGTQVNEADPHGPGAICPACGREMDIPPPSPSFVWPEFRARWPEHARELPSAREKRRRATRPARPEPSTPVHREAGEAGAFAAGLVGEQFFDIL